MRRFGSGQWTRRGEVSKRSGVGLGWVGGGEREGNHYCCQWLKGSGKIPALLNAEGEALLCNTFLTGKKRKKNVNRIRHTFFNSRVFY